MQNPESVKLRKLLPELNRQLHEQNAFGNNTFVRYLKFFDSVAGAEAKTIKVLDFGCGSNGGIIHFGYNSIPYDPYVDAYSKDPWGEEFDAFFSADVFEHMPVSQLVELLKKLNEKKPKLIFFVAATREANRVLANGLNAHITVEDGDWWYGLAQAYLHENYTCKLALNDMLSDNALFCFTIRQSKDSLDVDSFSAGISPDATE